MSRRMALTLSLLAAGCARSSLSSTSGTVIGPSGGVLTSPDGQVVVTIPSGAVASEQTMSIAVAPSLEVQSDARAVGPSYQLSPVGLALQVPAQLTVSFPLGEVPAGATPVIFAGAVNVAPMSALQVVVSDRLLVGSLSKLLELQLAAIVASACHTVGGSCQTSQDCCASMCSADGRCVPFTTDAGSCSPNSGSCQADGDCCSGHCSSLGLCLNGFPVDCTTSAECPSGTMCRDCLHQCVFPGNDYCDSSAPCDCGFTCEDQICASAAVDAGAPGCTANRDCPANQACNPFTGQCQFPMCSGIAGQPLDDGGVLAPEACTPEDVGSTCPNGLTCMFVGEPGLQFACLQPCEWSTDCAVGYCSYGPVHVCGFDCTLYCASDADCPQDEGVFCENGACVNNGC